MTNQQDNRIVSLYSKFMAKKASIVELEEFDAFLNTPDAEKHLFELLEDDYQLSESLLLDISEIRARMILEEITSRPQERGNVRRLWVRLAGVAAVIAIIVFSILVNNRFLNQNDNRTALFSAGQDIPPGTNSATLTLSDGRKIVLSAAAKGTLAAESGIRISKTSNGEITYEIIDNGLAGNPGLNTLSTKRGETYRVKLPDGSLVWLNAASSLQYPASFAGFKNREVDLEGEAYFEIKKDAVHPFHVKTKGQEVTVLGTHFNIKAYKEETEVITTLLEGSVRVNFQASAWSEKGKVGYKDEVQLSPGQQSSLKGESISIAKADMEENTAWKDGDFIFTDQRIEQIMSNIARWYDIEVIYEERIPDGTFSGNVSRSKNISQVLLALEATKLVHFKIEGRKVYVKK